MNAVARELTSLEASGSPAWVRLHPIDDENDEPMTRGERAWIAFGAFLTLFVAGSVVLYLARLAYRLIF